MVDLNRIRQGSVKISLPNVLHIDRPDFEILEQLVRLERGGASVLAAGPQRRRGAIGVADVQVVEVDRLVARLAAGKNDAVLAERGAAESHDAWVGALVAAELFHAGAGLEERAERLLIVAFERREIGMSVRGVR